MAALTIEFPQTVWTVEFGGDEIVVAEVTMTGGTGGGGTFDGVHNDLDGRSTADAHPISAITGLTAALEAGGASALADLTDVDVETDPPAPDDVLAWDGTKWTPATLEGGAGGGGGPDLSNDDPADLGTADSGASADASRADHVHDMPTAADVGADAAGTAAGLVDDLSGVTNAAAARSNLGLGALATLSAVSSAEIVDGTIVNADVGAGAAIALSKLAVDPLARANHTGTQAQSTVTNLVSDLAGKAATVHTHSGADLTSGTVASARLGSGTADASTFLRGDGTWSAPVGQMTPTAPTGSWFQMTPGATYLGSPVTAGYTTAASNETATLWFLHLSAAVSINGMSFYCDTANAGIGARAALALWAADGPNGSPGTAISAPSANAPITTAGEKTPTWSTPVNLPAGGVWFALVPFGLDTAGVNPKFWGWNSTAVVQRFGWSATSPEGNNRTPRLQATATGGVPTSNPTLDTIASQGGFVPAVSVRVA